MFKQGSNVRDHIFPLVRARRDTPEEGFVFEELIGTGFFIGSRGFALTAGHVIDQLSEQLDQTSHAIVALFTNDTKWYAFEVDKFEKHPNEDAGIVKLKSGDWSSILKLTRSPQYSAGEYHCWGYPHEVAKELMLLDEDALQRPDLVFTQGYVRRRISRPLYPTMIYRGEQFYEISEIVGGGNSGGPLVLKSSLAQRKWEVFGIYIGENEKVGYATRAEAFCDWAPVILGRTTLEESNT